MDTLIAGDDDPPARRLVRVWFGSHVIANYRATPDLADRYAAAMERKFFGLTVTNEPLPIAPAATTAPLPGQIMWDVAPR